MTELQPFMGPKKQVLICQNTACRKAGSQQILQEFQRLMPAHITVKGVGCLGECGNGPMAVVLPEIVWYGHIRSGDVSLIVKHHVINGEPVVSIQYKK